MKLSNFTSILISLSLVFYLLYIGASFFIPLVIAIVVWYLIITLTTAYEKIKLPYPVAMAVSVTTIILFFSVFMMLINANINNVVEEAPNYQEKFQGISEGLMARFGIAEFEDISNSINISSILESLLLMFKTVAGYVSMIVIYTLFLLLEYRLIGNKLKIIFSDPGSYEKFCSVVAKINKDIKTYIKIKTLASFSTGLLSFFVLLLVGVDFPLFWAMLIFLLNYIPTVGSIVAILFPIMLSLVQFDSLAPFFIVTIFLISIQILIGNILEPKFMGKSLNLSPLVILIALTIWGSIWGVVGMFLCVPILVILNIVLAKFDKTRNIAVMLSARGRVE